MAHGTLSGSPLKQVGAPPARVTRLRSCRQPALVTCRAPVTAGTSGRAGLAPSGRMTTTFRDRPNSRRACSASEKRQRSVREAGSPSCRRRRPRLRLRLRLRLRRNRATIRGRHRRHSRRHSRRRSKQSAKRRGVCSVAGLATLTRRGSSAEVAFVPYRVNPSDHLSAEMVLVWTGRDRQADQVRPRRHGEEARMASKKTLTLVAGAAALAYWGGELRHHRGQRASPRSSSPG